MRNHLKRRRGIVLALILGAVGVLTQATGCGYQFHATGQAMGLELDSLAIPLIESTSSEIGFESDFTRILREEFLSHATVPLVSAESATAVLIGRIYQVKTDVLSYDREFLSAAGRMSTFETTSRRRLRVKLDIRLMDRKSGKIIWQDKAMEGKANFLVEPDPLATRHHQKQALERIAYQLAKKIYLKTMERF